MAAAAASSETSSGSSRATTISPTPARVSASTSWLPISGALLQHQRAATNGMDGDPANRVRRRHGTELHAAAPVAVADPASSRRSRSTAVICAMIATAISAGDTAPMASPIGAWMRASAASRDALRLQPVEPPGVRLSRSERADIEALAHQRVQQRRIVDLGIMGERDERRVAVDIERRQRHVRPLRDQGDVGKPLGRGKGGARIDDRHLIVERAGKRRQRLADMNGAGDDEVRHRRMNRQEHLAAVDLDHAALAHAQMLCRGRRQAGRREIGRLHQPLCPARRPRSPRSPAGARRARRSVRRGVRVSKPDLDQ